MAELAPARRGFLRGLVSLPLVGGGVTLLGNPTAAAVPVTPELLDSYDSWLMLERMTLLAERYGVDDGARMMKVLRCDNPGAAFHDAFRGPRSTVPPASTRAALVLSAVGCDLRQIWRRSDSDGRADA